MAGAPRDGGAVRGPLIRITLANLGFAQVLYLSLLVILPDQSARIGGSAHKTTVLAVVAAVGALVALIAAVGAGHLSDRRLAATGSRGGVLAVGAVLGGVLLAVLPVTGSVALLLVVWCGVQIGLNGVLSVVTAALADWFSVERRGVASAYAALGQVLGAVVASVLVLVLSAHPAIVSATGGLLFLLTVAPMIRPPYALGAQAAPTDEPTADEAAKEQEQPTDAPRAPGERGPYVDVALAWSVRVVVTFSNTLVVTFLNYYVTDVLRPANPQRLVGLAAGLTSLMVAVGAVLSGRASDRLQRRRPFVIASVVVMCLGELLLAGWQNVPGALIAAALVGFGYGVYLAVDQALSADVLPHSRAYGRDFGIMNTATAFPQIIAPAVAAVLLGSSAQSAHYSFLFAVGALTALSGVGFVLPIKRVR